jgi:hypothetical protein
VVRAAPAKMKTEACVNCGGALKVTATGSGGRQESRVVRATPAKMETEVRVSCGGALSEVGCCGSECSQQTRLVSPPSLLGKTWCYIPSRRLLTIQSHFSLVVIVTTIRIQLADSSRRRLPLTTTVRLSTASILTLFSQIILPARWSYSW